MRRNVRVKFRNKYECSKMLFIQISKITRKYLELKRISHVSDKKGSSQSSLISPRNVFGT